MSMAAFNYLAKDICLVKAKKEILNIEELRINEGEVFALVGPNGAGKSSLLLTLALLWRPNRGSLKINGTQVTSKNILEFRRQIAVVFQEPLLMDTTVRENITIGLRIRGVTGKSADYIAAEWLARMGVGQLGNRPARYLSGGEAQRVNLARALALQPRLLFLDEPFAALDYPTRCSLIKEISAVLHETRITTIFVTHDYTEIPALAHRVGVMLGGRLVKCGSVEAIFGKLAIPNEISSPWELH
jgi:tungstate transport system ATP-binding protein